MTNKSHGASRTASSGQPQVTSQMTPQMTSLTTAHRLSHRTSHEASHNTSHKTSLEISHPEYMYIRQGEKILYGCNQDWYGIEWRRRAGCGPVAATNILLYLRKKYDAARIPYSGDSIDDALAAMNDMFTYVRPRLRGLNTVKMFVDGMYKFGQKYGLSFWHQYLLVPPQAEKRPDLDTVVRFIEDGVKNDVPVAFLNLHAGEVEAQLAGWHWVTVVGIAKGETPPDVRLRYFDQSEDLEVDLGKWLRTTKRGGGFAYFCKPSPRPDFCPADAPKDAG